MCREEFARKIDREIFPGIQGGPLMHVIAAKAVAFGEAQTEDFRKYQSQVVANARTLAEDLMQSGFRIFTGGTDNHLMLMDLRSMDLSGRDAEEALGRAGITANKNTIPYDERPATVTSGVRLGTPCVTSRGMGEEEMHGIARAISEVLQHPDQEELILRTRARMKDLCTRFPIY